MVSLVTHPTSISSVIVVVVTFLGLATILLPATAAAAAAATAQSQEDTNNARSVNISNMWEVGYTDEIYDLLRCDANAENSQSIHSLETWALLQSTYSSVVDKDTNSLPPGGFVGMDGWYVKYDIEQRQFGRSIVAKENIARGTTVWKSFNTGRFYRGSEYRNFLKALPQSLACDVIHWAYTRLDEDDTYMVCVDMDSGSFVNECVTEYACNLVLSEDSGRYSGCDIAFVAARDIAAGEELQTAYSFAEGLDGWEALGLKGTPKGEESDPTASLKYEEDVTETPPNPHSQYLKYLQSLATPRRKRRHHSSVEDAKDMTKKGGSETDTTLDMATQVDDFEEWPTREALGDTAANGERMPLERESDSSEKDKVATDNDDDDNDDKDDDDDDDNDDDDDENDEDDDDEDYEDEDEEIEFDEAMAAHLHYQHVQYMQYLQQMEYEQNRWQDHRKENFAGVGKPRAALLAWDQYEEEWDDEEDETEYPNFEAHGSDFEPWPTPDRDLHTNEL